jgi:serine/threonine-protein kinase
MKVLGGTTLANVLAKTPIPREGETLDDLLGIFVKVCDAVAFAHSRGVVHRDLKPQNVMVDTYGRVYVMDWGLARALPGSEAARVLVSRANDDPEDDGSGTIAYMAPEQARPGWRAIGPWTDVYALGAILYEIITGTTVHVAGSIDALRALAYKGEIDPPASRVPGGSVSPVLARIALTATAREPQHRHARVEDLAREIERFRRGGSRFPTQTFEPGARVVTEGDAGTTAYVIERGRCVAYKTVDGRRVVLREMGPGDVFGEMAVISSRPRTATVEALEPLVVHVIERELLSEGLALDTWMGAFVRTLVERFREADEKLTRG